MFLLYILNTTKFCCNLYTNQLAILNTTIELVNPVYNSVGPVQCTIESIDFHRKMVRKLRIGVYRKNQYRVSKPSVPTSLTVSVPIHHYKLKPLIISLPISNFHLSTSESVTVLHRKLKAVSLVPAGALKKTMPWL